MACSIPQRACRANGTTKIRPQRWLPSSMKRHVPFHGETKPRIVSTGWRFPRSFSHPPASSATPAPRRPAGCRGSPVRIPRFDDSNAVRQATAAFQAEFRIGHDASHVDGQFFAFADGPQCAVVPCLIDEQIRGAGVVEMPLDGELVEVLRRMHPLLALPTEHPQPPERTTGVKRCGGWGA